MKAKIETTPSEQIKSMGFTIVETIVVLFIITTLTSILLSNFSGINSQLALKRVAYQLAQDLRTAQQKAISMNTSSIIIFPYHLSATWTPYINLAPTGYGIYFNNSLFESNAYMLYGDATSDTIYETASDCGAYGPPPCDSVNPCPCWNSYNLGDNSSVFAPQQIYIQEKNVVIGGISNCPGGKLSINFTPPNPTTTIQCINAINTRAVNTLTTVDITLALSSDLSQTKVVTVNNSGLIYVK